MWSRPALCPELRYAGLLVVLFRALLDPEQKDRASAVKVIGGRIDGALNDVPSIDDDRIVRRLRNVVECVLRTNFFQRDDQRPRAGSLLHQAPTVTGSTNFRLPSRSTRSSFTAHRSKGFICASAKWRAAAFGGRIAARISDRSPRPGQGPAGEERGDRGRSAPKADSFSKATVRKCHARRGASRWHSRTIGHS